MTSVSGSLFGSKTLTYDDENRLKQITYGGVTDLYYYDWQGRRYRAKLNGTYYRYVYNGDRVLEETNDSGSVLARYTTESGSYYAPLQHMRRGCRAGLPKPAMAGIGIPALQQNGIGTSRGLVNDSATITDTYQLDAWGHQIASSGSTQNPYKYGAAWGYITDPSGLLQLGARFYWPELGRFVQRDPVMAGPTAYDYAEDLPTNGIDPEGLLGGKALASCFVSCFTGLPRSWFDKVLGVTRRGRISNYVGKPARVGQKISNLASTGTKVAAKVCWRHREKAFLLADIAGKNGPRLYYLKQFKNLIRRSTRLLRWAKWIGRANMVVQGGVAIWCGYKCRTEQPPKPEKCNPCAHS